MRDEAIEEAALELLAAYDRAHGHIDHLPIPLDHLVEFHLDLDFDWGEIPGCDENVPAALYPMDRKILMNDLSQQKFFDHPGLEPFSVAHEVGHWVLHIDHAALSQDMLPGFQEANPLLCRRHEHGPREWQAERFAACLLMPRALVVSSVEGKNVTSWPVLYALAEQWRVSISALTRRLRELSIVYVSPDGRLTRDLVGYHPLSF